MGDTSIEWTHRPGTRGRTWNPTQGCALLSAGCKNCYAMKTARRFAEKGWSQGLINLRTGKWSGDARLATHKLDEPLRWREPSTVFVNSMSDLFYEGFTDEQIAAVFGVMAACPRHTFIVLTKRAKRMRAWFEWAEQHGDGQELMRFGPSALLTCAWEACAGEVWGDDESPSDLLGLPSRAVFGDQWPLRNVWIGVSVENPDALHRLDDLRAIPAAVRMISFEPLLEDLGTVDLTGMGWAIAGCESGPRARPCHPAWLKSLRDQCREAGVPFFLKQARQTDDTTITLGDGAKRKPGRIALLPKLDGVQHAAFPEVAP